MSTSRAENPSSEISTQAKVRKALLTGFAVGISNQLFFPLDKLAALSNTREPKHRDFFSTLSREPGKALAAGFAHAVAKSICVFTLKDFAEEKLNIYYPNHLLINNFIASSCAAWSTVYIVSPLSVFKIMKYTDTQISLTDFMKNFREFAFRGVHTTGMRDAVNIGLFFGLTPILSNFTGDISVGGGLASVIGSLFGIPLSAIADTEKCRALSFKDAVTRIYTNQGGIRGFFNAWPATLPRVVLQGAATAWLMEKVQKFYAPDSPLQENQETKRFYR